MNLYTRCVDSILTEAVPAINTAFLLRETSSVVDMRTCVGTGDDNVLNQVGLSTFSQYQNPYGSQLTNNMLCAGYLPGGKSICFGDSGGPLVCRTGDRWFQYGISSFVVYSDENNPQCALPNYPPVFANVVTLLSWIQAKTGSQYMYIIHVYRT